MAAAFASAKGTPETSAVCYGCGKPDHLKKDCFAQKRAKPKIPVIYPQCHKGHHFANQCCSKYDSKGRPVQGNWNRSAGQLRALTQMPQPPTQMVLPQMPAPQAQPLRMPSKGPPQVFA
ncbi:GAK5 protein, partial [Hippolais icterina]|nr:GAK5 protein [Hippolais icterina]